jgi:hypothetical protein
MACHRLQGDAGMTVSHPMWPGRADHDWYEFLGSIGIRPGTLKNCYVRKATVTGLSSRQAVKISYVRDGVTLTLENVPVWIHTDIGTRLAMMKGVEQALPEDYFKDAALMFPFPGIENRYFAPEVLILCVYDAIENIDNVLAVIHILQNITYAFPSNTTLSKTYGMYVKGRIGWTNISAVTQYEYFLYDIINNRIASIPVLSGMLVPELPFSDAEGLADTTQIDRFLAGSINHPHEYIDMYDAEGAMYVVSDHIKGCSSMGTPYLEAGSCYPGGGAAVVYPAWVQDRSELNRSTGGYWQHIPVLSYLYPSQAFLFVPLGGRQLSGTLTWSNGLTSVLECELWEARVGTELDTSYIETETVSYNGASKTRALASITAGYTTGSPDVQVEQTLRKTPVQLYVTTPNFFSDPWVIDTMRVWVRKTTAVGSDPTYSCSSMSYADFGWQSDNTLINPTGLFDYVVGRMMAKYAPADTSPRATAASVLFYGFDFKATDLRIELLR